MPQGFVGDHHHDRPERAGKRTGVGHIPQERHNPADVMVGLKVELRHAHQVIRSVVGVGNEGRPEFAVGYHHHGIIRRNKFRGSGANRTDLSVLPVHLDPVAGPIRHFVEGYDSGNQAVRVILEGKPESQSQGSENGNHVLERRFHQDRNHNDDGHHDNDQSQQGHRRQDIKPGLAPEFHCDSRKQLLYYDDQARRQQHNHQRFQQRFRRDR